MNELNHFTQKWLDMVGKPDNYEYK
ncbi:MAG: hypothetical protein K0R28_4983, partial [Paenibacillus sp.]|nr:hypothetical protein [Paenibacillus sp.]